MTLVSAPAEPIEQLAEKHRQAVAAKKSCNEIWQMFYEDEWFQRRLHDAARFLLLRHRMIASHQDDVKQEALVQFARAIERDCTLGFRPERGKYSAFLATIIRRACQKGLRQFRNSGGPSISNESLHPTTDPWNALNEQYDLQHSISRLAEPYQSVLRMTCEGKTIEQIAKSRNKSIRTVYRWLNQGIEQLRSTFLES